MSINITEVNNNLIVWGATYAIREQIESLGGTWEPKLSVWKLPLLEIEATRKKLNDALSVANALKSSLRTVPSKSQHLSIRRAMSVYSLPSTKSSLLQQPIVAAHAKEVEKDPPVFFVQSVAEELAEAQKSRRSSGVSLQRSSGVSSRRSSYGSTQTGHLLTQEILSPQELENAVGKAKDEVRLAKKKLTKFGSIEFAAIEHAQRGQRGIEDACRALLAVEDFYLKEQALDEAALAWYNETKIRQ